MSFSHVVNYLCASVASRCGPAYSVCMLIVIVGCCCGVRPVCESVDVLLVDSRLQLLSSLSVEACL